MQPASDDDLDWLQGQLIGRIQSHFGYKHRDDQHAVNHTVNLMKPFSGQSKGLAKVHRLTNVRPADAAVMLAHSEFAAALGQLNGMVAGNQRQLEWLFRRYDDDGDDHIDARHFCEQLLGLRPNPACNKDLRYSGTLVRQGIKASQGLVGVTAVLARLRQQGNGGDKVSVLLAKSTLQQCAPGVQVRHVEAILREAAKPNLISVPYATVSLAGLTAMLRGHMGRRRRAAVDQAWQALSGRAAGQGTVAVDQLVRVLDGHAVEAGVAPEDIQAVLTSGLLQAAHGTGPSPSGQLGYAGWLDLHRDMSSLVGEDADWEGILAKMWAVAIRPWDDREHMLPFTPVATVARIGGGGSRLNPTLIPTSRDIDGGIQVGTALNNTLARPHPFMGRQLEPTLMTNRAIDARLNPAPFGTGARGAWPAHKPDEVPAIGAALRRGVPPPLPPNRGATAAAEYQRFRGQPTRYVGSIGGDTLGWGTTVRVPF